jgi:small multidrug resistance pump
MGTWALLTAAIALEVLGTVFLRISDGFTKWIPAVIVVVAYTASFVLLSWILRTGVPIGIVYAIWSAFGVTIVTLLGMALFDDKISWVSGLGIVIVIVGVVLVELGSSGEASL